MVMTDREKPVKIPFRMRLSEKSGRKNREMVSLGNNGREEAEQ